jgi:hypothetical protein
MAEPDLLGRITINPKMRSPDTHKLVGRSNRPAHPLSEPRGSLRPTESIILYTGQSVSHATHPKMEHGSRTAIPWVTPSWSALPRTSAAL